MVNIFKQKINIAENLLLVVAISIVLNVIPNLLFPGWRFLKHFGVVLLIVGYLLVWKKKNSFVINKRHSLISIILFGPLIVGGLSEFLRMFLKDTVGYNAGFIIITMLLISVFYQYVKQLYVNRKPILGEEGALFSIIKPYFSVATAIVFASILVFILIVIGVVDPYDWPLPDYFGEDFTKRMQRGYENYQGDDYYLNPLGIAVLMPNYVKVSTPLGAFGSFCGLSHEPHIGAYFATPAMFMIPIFIKSSWKRFCTYFFFIIYLLLAASTTNILGVGMVFFVQLVQKTAFNPGKMLVINSILILFIILIGLALADIVEPFLGLIEKKLSSTDGGGSAGVSVGYLDYLTSPTELVGDGMFIVPDYRINFINWDIGYLYSALYILHFIFIVVGSLVLITSRGKIGYIGFAGLYYFIHSLKFPLHSVRYPFSIFILFILSIGLSIYWPQLKHNLRNVSQGFKDV